MLDLPWNQGQCSFSQDRLCQIHNDLPPLPWTSVCRIDSNQNPLRNFLPSSEMKGYLICPHNSLSYNGFTIRLLAREPAMSVTSYGLFSPWRCFSWPGEFSPLLQLIVFSGELVVPQDLESTRRISQSPHFEPSETSGVVTDCGGWSSRNIY